MGKADMLVFVVAGFADPAVPGLGIAPLGRYAGPALSGRDRHPVIDSSACRG